MQTTTTPQATSKELTIGVFLPIPYQGGSLNGAKNIAKMIHRGSQEKGDSVRVIFSCVASHYDIKKEFGDLLSLGIEVRQTQWKRISKESLEIALYLKKRNVSLCDASYLYPTDGLNNFEDCDYWFVISDRVNPPLAPIKPYIAMIYDYIQRYIPSVVNEHHEIGYLSTARNADYVMVTTPQTYEDAIQYAGIEKNKVILSPMEFNFFAEETCSSPLENNYILWTTNNSHHKNHLKAFQAFAHYLDEYQGAFDLVITGPNTNVFAASCSHEYRVGNEHLKDTFEFLESHPQLKKRCHVLGNLSENRYKSTLANAKFLWHPTLIDNGTYSVVEAACLGVPSVTNDYPQMRFMDERFKLNLLFNDATNPKDMAYSLYEMERTYMNRKNLLPSPDFLEQFSSEKQAGQFWNTLRDLW